MTHDFTTLTSVLGRCSAKVADQVIAEIRSAINDAQQGNDTPSADLTEVSVAVHKKKAEQAAARRAKAAERRAQKAAAHHESCGEAEAELPTATTCGDAFTPEMVKYLRRCPDQHILSVLNSYVHLILTGQLIYTADDHRYLDNFIYLARTLGIIDNPVPPTIEQAATFLFNNPAIPLPRAERRALERAIRKQARHNR
ncbi:MAG: hypothetical protein ACI4AM_10545 [Muribaculaceae bacterium]